MWQRSCLQQNQLLSQFTALSHIIHLLSSTLADSKTHKNNATFCLKREEIDNIQSNDHIRSLFFISRRVGTKARHHAMLLFDAHHSLSDMQTIPSLHSVFKCEM